MTDAQFFSEFLRSLKLALGCLPSYVRDLEVGVSMQDTPGMLVGARHFVNRDEHDPCHRMNDGDVQIRFVRNTPQIRTQIGRVLVDIIPRPG